MKRKTPPSEEFVLNLQSEIRKALQSVEILGTPTLETKPDSKNTHSTGLNQVVVKIINDLMQNISTEVKTTDSKIELSLYQVQENENSEIFNYYWRRLENKIKQSNFYSEPDKISTLTKRILSSIKSALLPDDRRPKVIWTGQENQILQWKEYAVAKEVHYLLYCTHTNAIEYSNTTVTIREIVALLWSALKQNQFLKIAEDMTPDSYREQLLGVNLFEGFYESSSVGSFDERVHALLSSLNDCHTLIHIENIYADNLPAMLMKQFNLTYKTLSILEKNQLIKLALSSYINGENGLKVFLQESLKLNIEYVQKFIASQIFTKEKFNQAVIEIFKKRDNINKFWDFKSDCLKAIDSLDIEKITLPKPVSASTLVSNSLLTQSSSSSVSSSSSTHLNVQTPNIQLT